MRKVFVGLIFVFLLSSLFGVVLAAKPSQTVTVQFVRDSVTERYFFTITNNGFKSIAHFQLNLVVPGPPYPVAYLYTYVPGWNGGMDYSNPPYLLMGYTALAPKYYLKASGQNSITIEFSFTPPLALGSLSGSWSANGGHQVVTGTLPTL